MSMNSMNPGDVSEYDMNHHIFHKIQKGSGAIPKLSWEKLRSPSTPAAFIWGLGWHPKMTPHELAWWLGVKLPCNSDFVGK